MKNTKAFTLIEVLVVVLIIGILAAIAVPQYQKAVDKSRASQLLMTSKSLYDASKFYQLQNGAYATKMEDLDINFGNINGAELNLDDGSQCVLNGQYYVYCIRTNPYISIVRHYHTNILECYSYGSSNPRGDSVCQLITGADNYYPGCNNGCRIYATEN